MWPRGSQYESQLIGSQIAPPSSVGEALATDWRWMLADYFAAGDDQTGWAYDAYARAWDAHAGGLTDQDTLDGIVGSVTMTDGQWDEVVQRAIEARSNSEEIDGNGLAEAVIESLEPLIDFHYSLFLDAVETAGKADPGDALERLIGEVAEVDDEGEGRQVEEDPSARLEQLLGEVAEEVPQETDDEQAMRTHPFPPDDRTRDWIVQMSEYELKQAQDDGAQLAVLQVGDVILIGDWDTDGSRAPFARSARGHGAAAGTITVVSRGSTFSRGEIQVSGGLNRDAFKASLREFSKKEITWA